MTARMDPVDLSDLELVGCMLDQAEVLFDLVVPYVEAKDFARGGPSAVTCLYGIQSLVAAAKMKLDANIRALSEAQVPA